jgi:hypothetical protein
MTVFGQGDALLEEDPDIAARMGGGQVRDFCHIPSLQTVEENRDYFQELPVFFLFQVNPFGDMDFLEPGFVSDEMVTSVTASHSASRNLAP